MHMKNTPFPTHKRLYEPGGLRPDIASAFRAKPAFRQRRAGQVLRYSGPFGEAFSDNRTYREQTVLTGSPHQRGMTAASSGAVRSAGTPDACTHNDLTSAAVARAPRARMMSGCQPTNSCANARVPNARRGVGSLTTGSAQHPR
jgi:hypothetical protein